MNFILGHRALGLKAGLFVGGFSGAWKARAPSGGIKGGEMELVAIPPIFTVFKKQVPIRLRSGQAFDASAVADLLRMTEMDGAPKCFRWMVRRVERPADQDVVMFVERGPDWWGDLGATICSPGERPRSS